MRAPLAALGRGLAAGLVGGLLPTTVQALARLWLGVSPPAELVGDRIAPLGVGLAAATGGLGTELYRRASFSYDGLRLGGPDITPITPIDSFYTVTKNVVDPRVNAAAGDSEFAEPSDRSSRGRWTSCSRCRRPRRRPR